MKKVLIFMSNPRKDSFSNALANSYLKGLLDSGKTGSIINIVDENFDYNLKLGLNDINIEKSLQKMQNLIKESNHIVFVYPTWWYNMPGCQKSFIDRVFLSGYAYKFESKYKVNGLLKNIGVDIITTADGPYLYYMLVGNPGIKSLKMTMKFCGLNPIRVFEYCGLKFSTDKKKKSWIENTYKIGYNL